MSERAKNPQPNDAVGVSRADVRTKGRGYRYGLSRGVPIVRMLRGSMTNRLAGPCLLLPLVVGLGGCLPAPCDGSACVGVTFTIHVEGWDDQDEEQRDAHIEVVEGVLGALEAHGGRATIELGATFLGAAVDHDVGVPLAWEARHHRLGLHAATFSTGEDNGAFNALLEQQRHTALGYGIEANYISGACGPLDWVRVMQDVGFVAAAGMTGWCLSSYEPTAYPEEFAAYKDCAAPEDCHAPVPQVPEEVVRPWRAESSWDWLVPADSGLLLVSGSGSLRCLSEYAEDHAGAECDYDADDNAAALAHLDGCVAAAGAEGPEVCGVTWAIGDEPDPLLLHSLLSEVESRVESGDLTWTTVPDVIASVE